MLKSPLIKAAKSIKEKGQICEPRGLKVLEIRDHSMVIDNPFVYPTAKPLVDKYIRREFQWYLNGANNPNDDRICDHASMWKQLKQPDGSFASNYGQYMFRQTGGFSWVTSILSKDPDSRQAVIPFAHKNNMYHGNKDQICTLGVIFDIRNNKLNMTVIMRSNDVIGFGAPIDWCCFSLFHEMVAVHVGVTKGEYRHFVHSFHAYEKDFELMDKIIDSDEIELHRPPITDAMDLINQEFKSEFGQWLTEVKL